MTSILSTLLIVCTRRDGLGSHKNAADGDAESNQVKKDVCNVRYNRQISLQDSKV